MSTPVVNTVSDRYQDGQRRTLTIEEVARRLGTDRSSTYRLAQRDGLPVPVIRVGRRMFVSEAALDAVLARLHAAPGEEAGTNRLVG